MKKISRLAILGVAAAALILAAPTASAGCATAQLWGQLYIEGGATAYQYVVFPSNAASDATSVVGRYWQAGAFSGANNGTYDDSQWLDTGAGGVRYLNGSNGEPGVVGCPAVEQILVLETTGTGTKSGQAFLGVSRVDVTPGDSSFFNYNRTNADIVLRPVSITKVSESRVVNVVTVTVAAPQASEYFTGAGPNGATPNTAITGWTVLRKNATTTADDSRATAGWVATGTSLTNGGQGTVSVDCGAVTGQDVLLGLQATFQDGVLSNFISQSAVVKCSGNLADPSGKFKIIDRQAAPRPIKK